VNEVGMRNGKAISDYCACQNISDFKVSDLNTEFFNQIGHGLSSVSIALQAMVLYFIYLKPICIIGNFNKMITARKKLTLTIFACFTVVFALNLYAADSAETIKASCRKNATEKTGYDAAKASSSGNTAAKGAGAGALGGTAVRAI
jgi:hypothetical protein